MKTQKTVELELNGVVLEAELYFDYTPEIKGVYDKKPEDCYPTEPAEYDLTKLVTKDGVDCTWMLEHIGDLLIEQIENSDDEM